MSISRKLFLLVTVLSVLLMAMPALAQTTGAVEIIGTVEAMTLQTITINGQQINISNAEINVPVELGAVVRIEGLLNPDGRISAREVNPVAAGVQPGEAEIIGVIESLTGTTLVISGQSIDVSTAERPANLAVGATVKVHATASPDGIWIAREVEPFSPEQDDDTSDDAMISGEFEITGTLEAVADDTITVAGQSIRITGAEIKNALTLGVQVKVHVRLVDGMLVAREVENAFDDDDNSNLNINANTSVDTAVTAQDAIDRVLEIYPNTTILEIELVEKFGGTLVWEVKTSHGLELNIDAQTNVILTIERDDDDNANFNDNSDDGPGNANFNANDNNSNSNSNFNSNDNDDDRDNDNDDRDDDDDD